MWYLLNLIIYYKEKPRNKSKIFLKQPKAGPLCRATSSGYWSVGMDAWAQLFWEWNYMNWCWTGVLPRNQDWRLQRMQRKSSKIDDPFTLITELAKYNLEIISTTVVLESDCFTKVATQLQSLLDKADATAREAGSRLFSQVFCLPLPKTTCIWTTLRTVHVTKYSTIGFMRLRGRISLPTPYGSGRTEHSSRHRTLWSVQYQFPQLHFGK